MRTLPGIDPTKVSTKLPKDQSAWADGFVQIVGIGGAAGQYVPLHSPVVNVSSWAVNPTSGKPPWGRANQLSEIIKVALLDRATFPVTLDLSTFGDYAPARVHTAYFVQEPQRVPSDDGSFARYDGDLEVHWTPLQPL